MRKKIQTEVLDARGHRLICGDCVRIDDKDGRHVTTGIFMRSTVRGAAVVSITGIERVYDDCGYLTRVNTDGASTPMTWFHAGKPDNTAEFERLFSGGAP